MTIRKKLELLEEFEKHVRRALDHAHAIPSNAIVTIFDAVFALDDARGWYGLGEPTAEEPRTEEGVEKAVVKSIDCTGHPIRMHDGTTLIEAEIRIAFVVRDTAMGDRFFDDVVKACGIRGTLETPRCSKCHGRGFTYNTTLREEFRCLVCSGTGRTPR